MRPCTRLGVDVTWRCNWQCKHCFYLRNPKFHSKTDVPFDAICHKVDAGKRGGLDHVVLVGYGEPALYPRLYDLLDYAHSLGMSTSMITNGVIDLNVYQECYRHGLDHLHISSHGLEGTLEQVVGMRNSWTRQQRLKQWLKDNQLPFRTNVTIQRDNYRELLDLAKYEVSMGVSHFVFLGFLPHYEWHSHVTEIAVHPGEIRPYLEQAADYLLEHNTLFTIRYHPMCYLREDLWPYVTNARHVFFDPWEWNYSLQVTDLGELWKDSVRCGETVENHSCRSNCTAYQHCGGWNRVYAAAYGGDDLLRPITNVPAAYASIWDVEGGLHDLNPANGLSGTLRSGNPQQS